jgi:hypothetical protein
MSETSDAQTAAGSVAAGLERTGPLDLSSALGIGTRNGRDPGADLAQYPFGVPPRRLFHQRAAQLDRITLHLVVRQHDIKSLLNKRLSRAERKLSDTYFSFVDMIAS